MAWVASIPPPLPPLVDRFSSASKDFLRSSDIREMEDTASVVAHDRHSRLGHSAKIG